MHIRLCKFLHVHKLYQMNVASCLLSYSGKFLKNKSQNFCCYSDVEVRGCALRKVIGAQYSDPVKSRMLSVFLFLHV